MKLKSISALVMTAVVSMFCASAVQAQETKQVPTQPSQQENKGVSPNQQGSLPAGQKSNQEQPQSPKADK